ncbi:MAG: ferritin-like domain-containing protein [Candidatus Woesebacteria bacterium]
MKNIHTITSTEWLTYFQKNTRNLLRIPWESPYKLTPEEKERVIASVQQFELGENAEGKTFKRKALPFAKQHDPIYMDALDLFIKEEQRHSATLRRFLQKTEQPTLENHWVDSVFRRLRKLLDIEVEVLVLLTAEIIAMVYYGRLKAATDSPVLQTICEQILLDETQHINFQSTALYKIRRNIWWIRRQVSPLVHATLLAGTACLVWWQHNSVLSSGNFSFRRFLYEVYLVFNKSHMVSSGRA